MSARREIAVNWEAERYKEVWREGCRDIRRRGGLGWWGFRLYLRHGGVHHYSEQRFDVEAGWISGSRREAVLIKTVTMQPELPRRNGGFEESLNAPFRAGCPQITPDITLTDSEASVAKCVFFTTIYETFLSVCVCVLWVLSVLLSGFFGGVVGLTGVTDWDGLWVFRGRAKTGKPGGSWYNR